MSATKSNPTIAELCIDIGDGQAVVTIDDSIEFTDCGKLSLADLEFLVDEAKAFIKYRDARNFVKGRPMLEAIKSNQQEEQAMQFEVGRFYKHSSGEMMAIVGAARTHVYGWVLIAERMRAGHYDISPISPSPDAGQNWNSIPESEWLACFPDDGEKSNRM